MSCPKSLLVPSLQLPLSGQFRALGLKVPAPCPIQPPAFPVLSGETPWRATQISSSSLSPLPPPYGDSSLEEECPVPLYPSSSPLPSGRGGLGTTSPSLAQIPQPFPPSFKSQPLMAQLRRGAECSPLSVEGFLLPQPIRWYCWEEATSKGANRKIPCFIISEPHA